MVPTWDAFVEAFNGKYFYDTAREQKMAEFFHLGRTRMTVDQYEAKFAELSKYAPRLVEDPVDRARRFKDGLKPEIRSVLIPFNPKDYNDLYERARMVEQDLTKKAAASGSRFAPSNRRDIRLYGLIVVPLDVVVKVFTPLKDNVIAAVSCPGCRLMVDGHESEIDLVVPEMYNFDPIVGMDWLTKQRATMDCYRKAIQFRPLDGAGFEFLGNRGETLIVVISSLEATQLLESGCQGYLAAVVDTSVGETELENIVVVCEFLDVFPEELPGLPPEREIEFVMELAPGMKPISKAPCRMVLSKLKELKVQMQELVFKELLDRFIIVFIDDILVYSKSSEDHEQHPRIVLETLRLHQLFAKLGKCEFWLARVAFLGHVVPGEGITVDPSKIEAVIDWPRPTIVTEIEVSWDWRGYYK
ncbi:uncharacterized protein LOC125316460 [Rhodamnia argentea]|uniref:Uncharacterized protein LOC125316460 n=1 Tax=Rhodamnia argentea TaxID=178133 RepID=A0ABM3HVX9_9MYRT|nr:uncharacterized protein LOC125316460 [Rhodamnia argentea]